MVPRSKGSRHAPMREQPAEHARDSIRLAEGWLTPLRWERTSHSICKGASPPERDHDDHIAGSIDSAPLG
jgi:hypothetical protein